MIDNTPNEIPSIKNTVQFIKSLNKLTVPEILDKAKSNKEMLFQARSGVGCLAEMRNLLSIISSASELGISTVTIDSLTRNNQWGALKLMLSKGQFYKLNGFPLVTYGYEAGRELHECTSHPMQVRHGSPDARYLAEMSYASGATGFEGGGISYNLPYSKKYPLKDSLNAWQYVDWLTGLYQSEGIDIDRETFGTLTAVLVPPSLSIVISLLEGILMVKEGVKHVSMSFCQTGSIAQDIATTNILRDYAKKLLKIPESNIKICFHIWMGVFPRDIEAAKILIEYGVKTAYACGVERTIVKTPVEAHRIPTPEENFEIIKFCKTIKRPILNDQLKEDVSDEEEWIRREVNDLIEPILAKGDLNQSIVDAFDKGALDVPFAPSIFVKSAIMPMRDAKGKIRFYKSGELPFSETVKKFHYNATRFRMKKSLSVSDIIKQDIHYFSDKTAEDISQLVRI